MASNSSLTEAQRKQMNIVRYALMVIPVVAWVVAFAPVFLVSNAFGQNWIADALIPSLIDAIIVGIICFGIYWAYKRFVLKI